RFSVSCRAATISGSWRRAARRAFSASKSVRTSTSSATSSGVTSATLAPRLGSSRTRPSIESPRSASRTGTGDTPSSTESLSSTRRSPGLSLPSRIWPRIWSLTTLLRDARSVAMVLLLQGGHEGRDPGLAAGYVLFAVAAGGRDRSDALAVDEDRKAADEHGEAALVLGEDAEGLLAGVGVLVVVRALAMAGGGEGLVHGDLHAGHLAAVESPERDRIGGIVGDAEDLGHADLLCLLLRRIEDGVGFVERQGLVGVHVVTRIRRPASCPRPRRGTCDRRLRE